jgi:hypothetical protein
MGGCWLLTFLRQVFVVHRVVIKRRDHRDSWITEYGPWLRSKDDAENWAMIFHGLGYIVQLENMRGDLSSFA